MRRPIRILVVLVALAWATSAHASDVTPIVHADQLSRVHEVLPLDPAGTRLAVIASYGGETLRNAVFTMNADGSGMTRVDDGRGTFDFAGLRASPDGTRIVWSGALSGKLGIATATATGWRIAWPRRGLAGYTLGRDGTLFTSSYQSMLRLMRPGGNAFESVPVAGLRTAGSDRVRRGLIMSAGRTTFGSCARILRRGEPTFAIGLGLLDETRHAMRFRTTAAGFTALPDELRSARELTGRPVVLPDGDPPCRVSDDGRTIATLATVGERRYVVVRHGERLRTLRVPARVDALNGISPSGRYLFVSDAGGDTSTYDVRSSSAATGAALMLLDTQTERVRAVTAAQTHRDARVGLSGVAVWSERESFAALRLGKHGTLVVDTHAGTGNIVPLPSAPPGVEWRRADAWPRGFSLDERRVVFTMDELAADVTGVHPYSAPVSGGPATPLLSDSVRSFGDVRISADRRSAWLTSSTSCRQVYPVALFRASLDGLFETPFTAPAAVAVQ